MSGRFFVKTQGLSGLAARVTGEGAVQAGQKAQLDEQLEAVAYAQDQPAVPVEFLQALVEQCAGGVTHIAPAHACGLGCAEIVAIQEAARENEKIVLVQRDAACGNVGEEDNVCLVRTSLTGCVGGLHLGIGTVALNDEGVDSAHMTLLS